MTPEQRDILETLANQKSPTVLCALEVQALGECVRAALDELDAANPSRLPIITDADREASPQFHAALKAAHEVKAARESSSLPWATDAEVAEHEADLRAATVPAEVLLTLTNELRQLLPGMGSAGVGVRIEAAVKAAESAVSSPAPPAWTRETPSKKGVYWYWDPGMVAPEVRDFRYKPLPRPRVEGPIEELRFQSVIDWWLGPLAVPLGPENQDGP